MRQNLGISVRFKFVASFDQSLFELFIIFYYPIVTDKNPAAAVGMRVGVSFTWLAVGGPASVGNPNIPVAGIAGKF